MNLIDWMRATSQWMRADRPDLFDTDSEALDALEGWMEQVRSDPDFYTGIEGAGFLLSHIVEDGAEEWQLLKIISSCVIFDEDEEPLVLGWTKHSGSMKHRVDLPDVTEGLDI